MPMLRGRRPSTAALTRLGARKASEMVILICRTLQFSRVQSSLTVVTRMSAFSQSIQIGPGGVRIDEGRGRGGAMRGIAACLRKQGQARGARRRKLTQKPGNLPKASPTGRGRWVARSLPKKGSVGGKRRRKFASIPPDFQRSHLINSQTGESFC